MALYVVRHAHAGRRSAWHAPDDQRPLSSKGEKEALGIADQLEGAGITRLLSSPAVRCVQTLQPLAERLGRDIETDERLAEGGDVDEVLALCHELETDAAIALCTHGDIVPELLHRAATDGARFDQPLTWPKGSTWVFERDGERVVSARFLPTPT